MTDSRFKTGIAQDEEATEWLNYQMYKMSLKHVIYNSKEAIKSILLMLPRKSQGNLKRLPLANGQTV